ncbi:unnamed protein product, partial [Allacma fusca]
NVFTRRPVVTKNHKNSNCGKRPV